MTAEVVNDAAKSGLPTDGRRYVRDWLRETHFGENCNTRMSINI